MSTCSEIREILHGRKFKYSVEKYPFKKILEKTFGVPLEDIHKWVGTFNSFTKYTDQNTIVHKVFYANFALNFKEIYEDFIINEVAKFVPEDFFYQQIPTFRIGLPGNKFVGEFHKDLSYNHQDYELNFNVGLSNYLGQASLKTEEKPNSNKFIYLECPYGETFCFDHINCMHGSEENLSDQTMVSFDFRLALEKFYFESNAESIGMNTKFNKGYYFSSNIIKSIN